MRLGHLAQLQGVGHREPSGAQLIVGGAIVTPPARHARHARFHQHDVGRIMRHHSSGVVQNAIEHVVEIDRAGDGRRGIAQGLG